MKTTRPVCTPPEHLRKALAAGNKTRAPGASRVHDATAARRVVAGPVPGAAFRDTCARCRAPYSAADADDPAEVLFIDDTPVAQRRPGWSVVSRWAGMRATHQTARPAGSSSTSGPQRGSAPTSQTGCRGPGGHSFIARWCGLCLNRYLWRCRPAAAVDIDACTESSLGWRAPSRQHRRDPAITAGALDGLPRTSSSGPSVSANPPSLGVVGHPPKTSGQLAPSHPQPGTFPFDLARTFDLISSTSSLPPPAATVPL